MEEDELTEQDESTVEDGCADKTKDKVGEASSVESSMESESDMDESVGTAKRPASPVARQRAKLRKEMEDIEGIVSQRQ